MFDLENVPKEMKEAMYKMHAVNRRLRKAEDQMNKWKNELSLAQTEYAAVEATYHSTAMRWNPTTNAMDALEELSN